MTANDGVRRGEAARSSNSPFTRRHANSIGRPTRPRSIFAQHWNLASSTSAPANAMSRVRFGVAVSTGRRNTLSYGEMECALMGRRFHRGFTAAEKTELWDRWKRGESLKAIGRAFGKPSSSIYFLVAPHGGIRPAQRRRSRLALTLAEREVISRGIKAVCT